VWLVCFVSSVLCFTLVLCLQAPCCASSAITELAHVGGWGYQTPRQRSKNILYNHPEFAGFGLHFLHSQRSNFLHEPCFICFSEVHNIFCFSSLSRCLLVSYGVLLWWLQVCNTFLGTVTYMSPERINNEQYSFSADIWSLVSSTSVLQTVVLFCRCKTWMGLRTCMFWPAKNNEARVGTRCKSRIRGQSVAFRKMDGLKNWVHAVQLPGSRGFLLVLWHRLSQAAGIPIPSLNSPAWVTLC
jgi:serine/threonine protein kinase